MIELKGSPVSNNIINELNEKMEYLSDRNIIPKLSMIRFGSEEDDILYEKSIIKKFDKIGVKTEVNILPIDTSEDSLIRLINKLNKDKEVHGIIVFNSLPKQMDKSIIKTLISEKKDVDCMTYNNIAKVFIGDETGFKPCTAEAVIRLLDYYNIDVTGKKISIIGRSNTVGKPLSIMLLNKNATITICHTKTKNLIGECKNSDIIICCAGKANLITEEHINKDQIIINVGMNYIDGKFYGDVDYDFIKDKVKMITPIIGGIGIITTTILLKNTIESSYKLNNK